MKRRNVISLLAGASLAVPSVIRAQPASRAFRIATFPDEISNMWRGRLSEELRNFGRIEGRDFTIVPSGYAANDPRQDEAAKRVIANNPDLILTNSSAFAVALQRATTSIPIVMIISGYPVVAGLADSLAKPGRNVTGNSMYAGVGVWSKMLQLLRDAKPDIERVGVLWAYVAPRFLKQESEQCYAELNSGARSIGLKLNIVEVPDTDQIKSRLAEIEADRPDALLLTSFFNLRTISAATQFAVDRRLPTIADLAYGSAVVPSPMLTYSPEYRGLARSAAATIDKIIGGARPGDLPIQLPSRFALIVSLKTAKTIGLEVPPTLIALADQVTE